MCITDQDIERFRAEVSTFVGETGLVAIDRDARVLTIIPTILPISPIVVSIYDDDCVAVRCGANYYQEISSDFGLPLVLDLVKEIIRGGCTEYIVLDGSGIWLICQALALPDGSYSQEPQEGRRLVSWRHPSWAGKDTGPEVTVL